MHAQVTFFRAIRRSERSGASSATHVSFLSHMWVPPHAEHRDLLPSGLIAAKDLLSFECPVETGFPVLGQVIIMKGKAGSRGVDCER